MNHDEAMTIAFRIADAAAHDKGDGISKIVVVAGGEAIYDVCTREAELAAEAMKERCAQAAESYPACVEAIPKIIRSLSTSDALAEHDRQVRLSEAEWWWEQVYWLNAFLITGEAYGKREKLARHLAALRQQLEKSIYD